MNTVRNQIKAKMAPVPTPNPQDFQHLNSVGCSVPHLMHHHSSFCISKPNHTSTKVKSTLVLSQWHMFLPSVTWEGAARDSDFCGCYPTASRQCKHVWLRRCSMVVARVQTVQLLSYKWAAACIMQVHTQIRLSTASLCLDWKTDLSRTPSVKAL